MRAQSAQQRFPVAQWKDDLAIMHETAIKMSQKQSAKQSRQSAHASGTATPASETASPPQPWSRRHFPGTPASGGNVSEPTTRAPSPSADDGGPLSLGSRVGPGHGGERQGRVRNRLSKPAPGSRDSSVHSQSAKKSIFRSARSSRANSPDRSTGNAKQTLAKELISRPMALAPAAMPGNRVSRITEHMNEDNDDTTTSGEGDIRQFDFSHGVSSDDSIYSRSGRDEGEGVDPSVVDEYLMTPEQVENESEKRRVAKLRRTLELHADRNAVGGVSLPPFAPSGFITGETTPSRPGTPLADDRLISAGGSQTPREQTTAPAESYLSLGSVLQGKSDYKLQNVAPFFNDPTGLYYQSFEQKLGKLNGKNSETSLCIEDYLMESEKDWFNRYRNVKLGKSAASSRASSIFRVQRQGPDEEAASDVPMSDADSIEGADQFLLQDDYVPPSGIRKLLLRRIGQWPLYTFLLAFVSDLSGTTLTLLTLCRAKSSQPTHTKLLCSREPWDNQQRSCILSQQSTSSSPYSGGLSSVEFGRYTYCRYHSPSMASASFYWVWRHMQRLKLAVVGSRMLPPLSTLLPLPAVLSISPSTSAVKVILRTSGRVGMKY